MTAVDSWRIWYTSDRQYNSVGDDWQDLPDDGVLALVIYYDEYSADGEVQHRFVHDGEDWYFHEPGTDFFGSNQDTLEENQRRYPNCIFKRGKWVPRAEYKRVRQQAIDAEAP